MKTRWMLCALFVAVAFGYFAGVGYSEDPAPDGPAPEEDPMMKKMIELGKPGPMHKLMDHMVGEFDAASKSWMKPGEPTLAQGVAKNSWVHGGRYIQSSYSGPLAGMQYVGSGLMGFDNFKKQFQQVWIDNMSTSMSVSTGSLGKDGKTITLHYTWDGPMGKIPGRMAFTIHGKDSHKIESWATFDGKETKNMEMDFTRRLADPDTTK